MAASVYAGGRRVADMMIDEAKAWSKKKDHVVWIGMHEPGKELLERVADQLHLHPLAIEDASNAHQQPKVEQYGDALFVVARTAQMADGHIDFGETHLFVGEGMMAAQLIACHNASMECYRRSMIGEHGNRRSLSNIHVHEGGQAIVGNVEGGGMRTKSENQPHALGYAPGQTLRSENTEREALPVAGDGER